MAGKEYGLILPKKKKDNVQAGTRVLNPLATSDDELEKDDGEALNWVEASLKKSAGNSGQKSLQKRLLREAYEEDATVFQYDEVYDNMKASQQEEQEKKKQLIERKPKYIETILKHSEKRKLENERRMERKVQKEREAEGNEFADKESFVTTSYLKKLEELKQAEQDEQREKYLEEQIDVHKHKNFGVFYNHIFKQRVGETEIKQEPQENESSGSSKIQRSAKDSVNDKTSRQKNYRTQEDISDEERESGQNISIKKEIVSSSSDEKGSDSENDRRNRLTYANGDRRRKSVSRDRVEKSAKNRRSRSRERKEIATDKRRQSRSRSKDRNNSREKRRSRSQDKRVNSVDNHRNNLSRNEKYSDKHRRSRSVDRHRRDKDHKIDRENGTKVDRYAKESNGRKRETSVERSMNRKEKRRRENSRERSDDRSNKDKHSEHKNRERKDRSTDELEKDKERKSKEHKNDKSANIDDKNKTSADKATKQSINTTLGVTDINKMKIEDRIKRFSEIFAKRTVDRKFDEAVQRYFQRRAQGEVA